MNIRVTKYDPISGEGGIFIGHINTFLKFKAEANRHPFWVPNSEDEDDTLNLCERSSYWIEMLLDQTPLNVLLQNCAIHRAQKHVFQAQGRGQYVSVLGSNPGRRGPLHYSLYVKAIILLNRNAIRTNADKRALAKFCLN